MAGNRTLSCRILSGSRCLRGIRDFWIRDFGGKSWKIMCRYALIVE